MTFPDYIVTYCTKCTTTIKNEFKKKKERPKECDKCKTVLKYKCPVCSLLYSSLNHARRHQKFVCNKEPRFSCSHCDHKTNSSFNMNIHMQSKHRSRGPKENLCYKCGLMYETYRYLLQHEKRCGIPSHIKRQTKNYRFFCDNCDYKCEEKIRIKRHIEQVHNKPSGASCSICGRVFKFKKSLENHRIISRTCAKKALEMDKIDNIPLSKRSKKENPEKKLKNKKENKISTEEQVKHFHKDISKPQEVEQEKDLQTITKSRRSKNVINYKNLTRERF